MSRILITGANGFIGRAVTEKLAANKGHVICAAVRKSTIKFQNAVKLFENLDLSREANWSDALKTVEIVIHCAARVHILSEKSQNPLKDFREINVDGTLNLAKQAAASGVKRFIFISSIGVNGEKTSHNPFSAYDDPQPHSPYTQSKMEAEIGLMKISQTSNMSVVIIRPPLVYDLNAPGNFKSLLRVARKPIPLPLSAVKNKRSFIFLDNLIDIIICCVTHPNAINQIFLVSDDEDLSTTQLIQKIRKSFKVPSLLFPLPVWCLKLISQFLRRPKFTEQLFGSLQVDIQKTKSNLGWKPPFSVDQAMLKIAGTTNKKGV